MAKLKITMANDRELHVERFWYDFVLEWFTSTIVHQNGKRIKLNNRYIIMTEEDKDDTRKA